MTDVLLPPPPPPPPPFPPFADAKGTKSADAMRTEDHIPKDRKVDDSHPKRKTGKETKISKQSQLALFEDI